MSESRANGWRLVDCRHPLMDPSHDFPSVTITNQEELSAQLQDLRDSVPGILFLVNDAAESLRFGWGGPFAMVECRVPASPNFKKVAYPKEVLAPSLIEFSNEGLGEPFWPRNLLPAGDGAAILVHFFNTRTTPTSVRWGPRIWEEYRTP